MRESKEDAPIESSRALRKDGGEAKSARCVLIKPMNLKRVLLSIFTATAIFASEDATSWADDSKSKMADPKSPSSALNTSKKSAWRYPTYSAARQAVVSALADMKVPPREMQNALRSWPESDIGPSPSRWVDAIADTLREASPELAKAVDSALAPRSGFSVPEFASTEVDALPVFVKDHLRLLAGRWLAQHAYYDEALEHLEGLDPNSLVDPATLLFYRASAHHQLLQKEECLTTVSELLENETALPQRFRSLAKLMQADLQPLQADSLDETSRLMESVERRLAHARAGKRVRDEEDAVVAKLDKLIEDLEKQRQEQQKQQQSGGASTAPPSKPMQDSQAAGGKGPGNVDPKKIQSLGAWGNIPPKQRQEALQNLSRDLPAHYREVVEEYFRKLASEEKPQK
jgi:hypothetical protein